MKHLLAAAMVIAAGSASADEAFSLAQFQMNQSLSGDGNTILGSFSTGYKWNDLYQLQGDIAVSKANEDTGLDFAYAVHGGYDITPDFTVGAFVGIEDAMVGAGVDWFHGMEVALRTPQTEVQLFATKNGGTSFPAYGNVEAGGHASLELNDRMSLVGRGIMRDNDDDDHVTFFFAGGVDFQMNNGMTLTTELNSWEQRVNWVVVDSGTGVSAGFKYDLDSGRSLFPQRGSGSTFFGNEFFSLP